MSQSQERRDRALQPITASVKIECHMETALSPRGGGAGQKGGDRTLEVAYPMPQSWDLLRKTTESFGKASKGKSCDLVND